MQQRNDKVCEKCFKFNAILFMFVYEIENFAYVSI